MKHNYFLFVFFILYSTFGFAQSPILCGLNEVVYISDSSNIPTVIDNGDGTITLTHKEQYITEIFAKYKIFDFSKITSSVYNISCQTKDLINELITNVPNEIFSIGEGIYDSSTIS